MERPFHLNTLGGRQPGVLFGSTDADRAVVIAPALGTRASHHAHRCDQLAAQGLASVGRERWLDAPHGGDHNRWPSAPGHVVARTLDFLSTLPEAA